MKRKPTIIKKPNPFHIMLYKKIYPEISLQYCIATFITGLIFLIISISMNIEPTASIIQTLACSMFVVSIYYIPFLDYEEVNEIFKKLSKYLILLIVTLVYSIVWYTYCNINANAILHTVLITLLSTEQLSLIVLCVFYPIKFIINLIKSIASKMKPSIENVDEKKNITLTEKILTNANIIISLIISLITLIEWIITLIEWIIKNYFPSIFS